MKTLKISFRKLIIKNRCYLLSTVILVFFACRTNITDEPEEKQPITKTNVVLKEITLEELGYKSIEEMYLNGWSNENRRDEKNYSKERENNITTRKMES